MPRATIKAVNKALPEGYELVRGKDYFYFDGPGTESWFTTSVPVFRVSHLTVEQWVKEFEYLLANKDKRG